MTNRFNVAHTVQYEGIRPDFTLSFARLMAMLQETAIAHTSATPLPFSWYAQNNVGFLLTNWHVSVNSYGALHDKVTAYTWPVYFKGIKAERSFVLQNENGEDMAQANTRWAFADLTNRRLVKIPDVVCEAYGATYEPPFTPDFTFPGTDGFTKIDEAAHTVLRSDIDSNFHVNNVKYIEWAIDYIPNETYGQKNVREMKTQYKKELRQNDTAIIETWERGSEYISLIKSQDCTALHAGVYTLWTII